MNETEIVNTAYLTWLNAILDTHARQLWNAAESEADDEHLEEQWEVLPERVRRRLWGLSADLFSLVDNEKYRDEDAAPVTPHELAQRRTKAFQSGRWDELLELLRRPPQLLADDQISYVRGRAWQELGHPHVALRFFDNASRLKPGHTPYRILALDCLKVSADWQAAVRRAHEYSRDPASPPALLFRAADVFHAYSMASDRDREQLAGQAVALVDQGLSKLSQAGVEPPLDSTLTAAFVTKAFCLEHLGRTDEALATYGAAIQRFPDNPELLAARGLLRLELHREDALDDFRSAVDRSARSVSPYLELARGYYCENNYDSAIKMCQLGINKADQDSVAALFFELRALALFQRHDSAASIERAFQTALALDPFNLAIRHNYERFRAVSEHPERATEANWDLGPHPLDELRRDVYRSVQPRSSQAA